MILGPHNGYIPEVDEIVKLVGRCHPGSMGRLVKVTRVFKQDGEDWFEGKYWDKRTKDWMFTGGILGGVEPVKEMRCLITNNLCGTDTWMEGHPCECEHCHLYLLKEEKK